MDINNKLFLLRHRKAILHEFIRIAHEQKNPLYIKMLLSKFINYRYKEKTTNNKKGWNYEHIIDLILDYYKSEYNLSSKKANHKLNILVGDLPEIDDIY